MDFAKIKEEPIPELKPFMPDFLEKRFSDLAELRKASEAGDTDQIKKICHQWKGFCEPYGFNQLTSYAIEFETSLDDKRPIDASVFVEKISSYLADKKRQINQDL